jgi:hypothetical protein
MCCSSKLGLDCVIFGQVLTNIYIEDAGAMSEESSVEMPNAT